MCVTLIVLEITVPELLFAILSISGNVLTMNKCQQQQTVRNALRK